MKHFRMLTNSASRVVRPPATDTSSRNLLTKSRDLDFYRYTSGRWLYNEVQQLSCRNTPFDVDALQRVAAKAVGGTGCITMNKTHEGSFNRMFSLLFENGVEVVAKIPFPLVSPAHLATASEVATMDFARTILGLPVPEVFTYSSDANNEVGVEYIIMEKMLGDSLGHRWPSIRGADARALIAQVNQVERTFSSRRFSQIGSIFYKKDLDPVLQSRRLYADDEADDEASSRFRIGPLMDWAVWRGSRMTLNVDRGPWPDTMSFIRAVINVEKQWLIRCAVPRPPNDIFSRSAESNTPAAHVRLLLDKLLTVFPHLIPPPLLCAPILWHTDLHGANILVEANGTPNIVGVIDWQGMVIAPAFLQAIVAPFARYHGDDRIEISPGVVEPRYPPDFDQLPESEKQLLKVEMRAAMKQKMYELYVMKYPLHFAVQSYPHLEHIIPPLYSASRTWYEGIHHLREHLIQIYTSWADINPNIPCPVQFNHDEVAHHQREFVRLQTYEEQVARLQKELHLEHDGWVSNERYAEVKNRSDMLKRTWDTMNIGGPYPYQDGGWSWLVHEQPY